MSKRAVRIRFRKEGAWPKGAEFELPSDEVAKNLYGDDIDILSYADGEAYDLNLREQAAERKDAADDVVVEEKTAAPKAEKKS